LHNNKKNSFKYFSLAISTIIFAFLLLSCSSETSVKDIVDYPKEVEIQEDKNQVPVQAADEVCGDGFCDNQELTQNSCPDDCGNLEETPSVPAESGQEVVEVCGDGFCSNNELLDRTCSDDCGDIEEAPSIPTDTGEVARIGSCGDGFCQNDELLSGSCPKDCG